MRSYYSHLQTLLERTQAKIPPRPTFRSSAIFPVFNRPGITSRILFMGYWILKRHIRQISCVITLRSLKGDVLSRATMMVEEPKTYRIELQDHLENAGMGRDTLFEGSVEVEFFSVYDMVFPFPATVINYYGPHFSSVVHTAQRIYNDFDDMQKNSETEVAESGFNIYADGDREPFFGMINGMEPVPNSSIQMQFFNADKEVLEHKLELGKLGAYETRIIYPAREVDLQRFLKEKVGAAKIRFHVNWAYPRLIAGNIQPSLPAAVITHTYYDCSQADAESNYWAEAQPEWHPAALMVPVVTEGQHFTNIYFYPIYSPSHFFIDIEIYNRSGRCLGRKEKALTIQSPSDDFSRISLRQLCEELGVVREQDLGARVIARSEERIPARIKLGLDLGTNPQQLPCNICTNLQPFAPSLENKPTSFRWTPFLADQENCSVWVMNSSPHVEYTRDAEMTLTLFREEDTQTYSKTLTLPPHGFVKLSDDPDLVAFFGGQVGWMTAVTSNPYTTTYYFTQNASGVVGGDHGF